VVVVWGKNRCWHLAADIRPSKANILRFTARQKSAGIMTSIQLSVAAKICRLLLLRKGPEGRVPESALLLISILNRLVQVVVLIKLLSCPDSLLLLRYNSVMNGRKRRELGTLPDRLLLLKSSTDKYTRFPSESGIDPVRKLLAK